MACNCNYFLFFDWLLIVKTDKHLLLLWLCNYYSLNTIVSWFLTTLNTSYKWNHTIFVFLWLTYHLTLIFRIFMVCACSVVSDSLRPYGLYPTRLLPPWDSPGKSTRLPFPSPGYLPNPGIKPRSPTLQADSLQSEPPGKPKNTGAYPFSRGIFPTQESNWGLLHCR